MKTIYKLEAKKHKKRYQSQNNHNFEKLQEN